MRQMNVSTVRAEARQRGLRVVDFTFGSTVHGSATVDTFPEDVIWLL